MERFKKLNVLPQALLVLLVVLAVIFAPLYAVTTSRVGFLYQDAILVPRTEDRSTVYEGKIKGVEAVFTVTADKTVTFRYGEKEYGPYTAVEDPTAVPPEETGELTKHMTGVELRCGEEVFFRGGVFRSGENWILYNEDGSWANVGVYATMGGGTTMDSDGNVVDAMAPTAGTILRLMEGPDWTHKGNWGAYFGGLGVSLLLVVYILFADELFRWNMSFRIRHADDAEPSDWELMSRGLTWVILTIAVIALYIMGLTVTL